MNRIFWIRPGDPPDRFPDPDSAYADPDGLLAAGGELTSERLLYAYRHGIFPWYSEGEPVMWWSPDPRCVFVPGRLHISRRLRRVLRRQPFAITVNTEFTSVIDACAKPRPYGGGTWITRDMRSAYVRLHDLGHAHSIEAWSDGELAGGLYGVAIGRIFFGESMFSAVSDASKVILAHLACHLEKHEFALIDCQVQSAHLSRMGSVALPRGRFLSLLDEHCEREPPAGIWQAGDRLPAPGV